MMQLNELLGNKELFRILNFFISNPTKEFSQTAVRKKIGISKTTLIKWIDKLEKNELLNLRKIGTSNLYKLSRENVIIKQIKILKSLLQLGPLKSIDAEIYVYGSAARGEDAEDSDIDIMLIGKLNRKDVIEDIDRLAKKIKRKISFKIFDRIEWSKIAREDNPFYERVEKDKIRLG
ncbi:nucleotidyltransferase domain-containing protein [Candidatus Woesearchaeota archaeon]|nr:nucleotidyltransferase domain-containing protein [Candidatus Woesearchaeota archaeon]